MRSPSLAAPYLPHLNGLRALGITGVLLYHLRDTYCPAGYFGVDIFLVLSGFLLTRSLFAPGVAEEFHYGRFLLKKAWRILPSWCAVVLLTVICSLLIMHPAQLGSVMLTASASAVFMANGVIDHSGDYFNPLSQQNSLLHVWYLSLSQQIYLLVPLLVIPISRAFSRRAALLLLSLVALFSFVFYLLTATPSASAESLLRAIGAKSAYYHLLPRFWEVAVGGVVWLLPELPAHPRLRASLGACGVMGAAASFFLYDTGSPAVYLAVASTLLAIRYANTGCAASVLMLKPVQFLGTISFSLYLWHWPLMVFWKYCCFDHPTPMDEWGMLAVSLLLAALSWRFIESRKIPATWGWRGTLQRCSLLLSLPLVGFCSLTLNARARQHAAQHELGRTVLIQHPEPETDGSVLSGLENLAELQLRGKPLRLGKAGEQPSFLLMGDSHAQHLYDALHQACQQAGIRGVYLNNTVSPYHGLVQPQVGADTCRWNPAIENLLLAYLDAHPTIKHVLIAQCWQMRMTEGYALNGNTGQELTSKEARGAVTASGLGLFCDRLRQHGCEAILLGETPRFPRPCPLEEWHRRQLLGVPQRERRMTVADFEERHAFPLSTLRLLAKEQRAHLIELAPALRVGDAYPANQGHTFWYYDANHLTPTAAQRVVQHLMPQLLQLLTSPH